MKITESQLRRIIREEVRALREGVGRSSSGKRAQYGVLTEDPYMSAYTNDLDTIYGPSDDGPRQESNAELKKQYDKLVQSAKSSKYKTADALVTALERGIDYQPDQLEAEKKIEFALGVVNLDKARALINKFG